jgi:hypothetical protein
MGTHASMPLPHHDQDEAPTRTMIRIPIILEDVSLLPYQSMKI